MRFITSVTLIGFFLFFMSTSLKAQSNQNLNIDIFDYLSLDDPFLNKTNSNKNIDLIRRKSIVPEFGPVAKIAGETPWINPEINFHPSEFLITIGDINGDGIDDLAKRFLSVPDERDSDISNFVNKSMIFYGGDDLSTDHDQLLYTAIYPLGDMNGDGFADAIGQGINGEATLYTGSSSGLTDLESTQSDTLLSLRQKAVIIRTGQNLNGDNFQDIFGYYLDQVNRPTIYFEIYGASSFENITFKKIELPSGVLTYPSSLFRFSVNDTVHLGFNTVEASTSEYLFRTYKFVTSDSLVLADSKKFNGTRQRSVISDFDGDGQPDLILINSSYETYFHKGISTSGQVFSEPVLLNTSLIDISRSYILGDIMGDSKSDILYAQTSGINIVNFDINSSSFVSLQSVNSSDILFDSELSLFPVSIYSDYSENFSVFTGFQTFSLQIQNGDQFGNVIFKTQHGSNDVETKLLLHNSSDHFIKSRAELFHLSDLENDGIDNFAFREIINNEDRLVLMNGLNDKTPQIIESIDAEDFIITHVQAGYFNGKEERSIAVLSRSRSFQKKPSQFRLYSIEDLETPYFSLQQTDLSPTLDRFDMFSNIGDINNDGFDDLALSAAFSNEPEKIYIFLGNTTLSSSADIVINLNEDFPNPVTNKTRWGATVVQGLGDLNGDGIDDFVLGDGRRYYNEELHKKNSNITGAIYVLYGQDISTPTFNGPDVELHADTSNTSNSQWIFGGLNSVASGDFDGDGAQDIVALAFRHANSDFDEGVGALTYFFGKNGFTSEPDTTIPIRTEYIYSPDQNIEETYSKLSGRALLQSIPDTNGDNADELLYVGNSETRNAVLYEIGESPTDIATAIYSSPNNNFSLNPSGNFINKQYLPLVGDYNGDGNLNFLGYQPLDRNYRDTPIYMYEIDNRAVSIADEGSNGPANFELKQNYPNPFNPSTKISFSIPKTGNVQITVYNILGQEVSTIVNSRFLKGSHSVNFNASNLASGIYLYRIRSNDFVSTKRMTLIK